MKHTLLIMRGGTVEYETGAPVHIVDMDSLASGACPLCGSPIEDQLCDDCEINWEDPPDPDWLLNKLEQEAKIERLLNEEEWDSDAWEDADVLTRIEPKMAYKNGKLLMDLNLAEIFNNWLDDEQQLLFAKHICWGEVLRAAVDHLADRNGGWGLGTWQTRFDFIQQVEQELISGYRWSWLSDLKSYIRDLLRETRILRKFHSDQMDHDFYQQWLKANEVGERLPLKGDPDVETLTALIEDRFDKLQQGIKNEK